MPRDGSPELRDIFVLTSAARTEHYEVVAYEPLGTMAKAMGERKVVNMLERNLKDERRCEARAVLRRLAGKAAKQVTERAPRRRHGRPRSAARPWTQTTGRSERRPASSARGDVLVPVDGGLSEEGPHPPLGGLAIDSWTELDADEFGIRRRMHAEVSVPVLLGEPLVYVGQQLVGPRAEPSQGDDRQAHATRPAMKEPGPRNEPRYPVGHRPSTRMPRDGYRIGRPKPHGTFTGRPARGRLHTRCSSSTGAAHELAEVAAASPRPTPGQSPLGLGVSSPVSMLVFEATIARGDGIKGMMGRRRCLAISGIRANGREAVAVLRRRNGPPVLSLVA